MSSSVVTKITYDDGTERSFGPVFVPDQDVVAVIALLTPHEDQRQADAAEVQAEAAGQANAERSSAAEATNQERIDLAAQGIDPDAEEAR